jgi:amidohydrolase
MAIDGDHQLIHLRHALHRLAEPSGDECATADRVASELAGMDLRRGIGGHGLAAVIDGDSPGPTVMLRADLDALPIPESRDLPHASRDPEWSHRCGHDGHMTMLIGALRQLASEPPAHGRVVGLFQPAEETGEGAMAVIQDPAFGSIAPDVAVAAHNLPGYPLRAVVIRAGTMMCASRGLEVVLRGATSHAAEPERGRSPAPVAAQIVQAWTSAPQLHTAFADSAQVTVTHVAVGEPTFGISPGRGRVLATLRATADRALDELEVRLRQVAAGLADAGGVTAEFSTHESFPATENDPRVVAAVASSAADLGLEVQHLDRPLPWSEDFGHFGQRCPIAMVGLGAGADHPPVHHPGYDFPDGLLGPGATLLERVARRLLEGVS